MINYLAVEGQPLLTDLTVEGSSSSELVRITQTGSGNALVIEDAANPDSTPFVIDALGYVGIGTTTPSGALDVVGTTTLKTVKAGSGAVAISSASYYAFLDTTTYNTSTPHGFATGDTVAVTGITPSSWNCTATAEVLSSTSFLFFSFNGSTSGAYSSGGTASGPPSTLYVDTTNDRIGIGTSSPSEKLDVVGNITLTGSVVFEGPTPNAEEITLTAVEPTVDRTITLPNATGTVITTGNLSDFTVTAGTTTTGATGVGYMGLPQNASLSGNIAVAASDAGKHIYSTATRTITIPGNETGGSPVAFPVGTTITFIAGSGATVTIAIENDTLRLAGPGTTGSRTLAPFGMATAVKIAINTWIISGNGLT